jgi:hypothetical protein
MTEKITIVKEDVINKDLSHLTKYFEYQQEEFHFYEKPAGWCEYKLYAYLANKVNDKLILEVGTRHGGSALAFSDNPSNKVISYDIIQWDSHENLKKSNIDLRIGNFMEDKTINYDKVDIIMIDVDPHDGLQEPPMIQFLANKNWSGLLLLDDISEHLWPAIYNMWTNISYEKYDLTDIGHFSGTGLINMGNKFSIEIL